MSPKKTASSGGGAPMLNPGEMNIIDAIFKSSSQKPTDVDWDNVRLQLKYNSNAVVKERFRQVCAKYRWFVANDANAAVPGTPSTPTSPSKKKANGVKTPSKKRVMTPHSEEGDTKPTPAKKRKAASNAKKAALALQAKHDAAEGYGDGLGLVNESDYEYEA
ncbi:hypothetical protein GGR54DRAFT_344009 [Hypoxylon sp. NC1633]|nr:hypothetical protein GGR54DRAFT_344009 [Hypoxylon sp. NC1633]